MSNARKLADNLPSVGQLSNRNLIINGAMQVAQRGTSFTGDGYSLDRIYHQLSGGTSTLTQETFALGSELEGFTKYAKQAVSTGNNYCGIVYKVEDVKSLPQGKATFSFYAKGTNPAAGSFDLKILRMHNGSTTHDTLLDTTVTLTSSWQRFTKTFDVGSLSGMSTPTANSIIYISIRQAGSDTGTAAWELNLTGLQLEVGSQASPFEHEPVGVTLSKCQRYFQHHQGDYYTIFLNGTKDDSHAYLSGSLSQVMRAKPSFSTANCYLYGRPSATVSYTATENRCNTSYATIGFTNVTGSIDAGEGVRFESNNSTGYVRYDAEL